MVMKSYLYWAGHVVQMDDSHLPKQLFYGEICKGKRKALKSRKRFKDSVKICISANQWKKMAQDRSPVKLIHVDIESFETAVFSMPLTYDLFVKSNITSLRFTFSNV